MSENAQRITNKEPRICAICGKPITEQKVSTDHVFPRAILKWALDFSKEEQDELKAYIESPMNKVGTHVKCNLSKQDAIMDPDRLHLTGKHKENLRKMGDLIDKYIDNFIMHKNELLYKQDGCCYGCGKRVKYLVIRRIDPKEPRSWDNACVVCSRCNTNIRISDLLSVPNPPKI